MYRWYQGAAICYAYLADVACDSEDNQIHEHVAVSEWFVRGWTLEELVAPKEVHFFNET